MDFGSWSNNVVTEVRIKSKMASGHKVLVRVGMNPSVQFELNQNPICNYHEWNNLGNGFDHNQGVDAVYNCPQPLPGRYVTVQLKDSRFDLFFQILSAEVFGYSDGKVKDLKRYGIFAYNYCSQQQRKHCESIGRLPCLLHWRPDL